MKITNERMTHHMTKEEKLRVLEKAEEKCFTCLDELSADDMSSGRVGTLLEHISSLQYTAYCLEHPDRSGFTPPPPPPPEPDTVSEEQPDVPAEEAETATEAPEAEDDDPAEEPESGEASAYDLDEIRVTLNRLHRAGKINVAEIFETMGYRTLSDIPASEYGRLMQLAGVE